MRGISMPLPRNCLESGATVLGVDKAIANAQRAARELEPKFAELAQQRTAVEAKYRPRIEAARAKSAAAEKALTEALAKGTGVDPSARQIAEADLESSEAWMALRDAQAEQEAELDRIDAVHDRYWRRVRTTQTRSGVISRSRMDPR